MADKYSYSDEEMNRYFSDPGARGGADPSSADPSESGPKQRPGDPKAGSATVLGRMRGHFDRRFDDPEKSQAAYVLSLIVGFGLLCVFVLGLLLLLLADDLPSTKKLENPSYQFATVAYTADGEVLARYALQNRSWADYDEISPHVVNALIATEDRRFYSHWGVDMRGIFAAVADLITEFDLRGASTITQQLARNLYNEQIGREVTITRKLKEMVTAVRLERRYTKREIIEMYLNTVLFGHNAWGIHAAAHTFYGVPADSLGPLQAATLVGMLQAITYYDPIRNPENAQSRRNVVLWQMVKVGYLDEAYYERRHEEPVAPDFHSAALEASIAPYFAEHVRNWMRDWSAETGHNFYREGLRVYTTLNSELQALADEAVREQTRRLQAVLDYAWSRQAGYYLGGETDLYLAQEGYEPFAYFWDSQPELVDRFVRETAHYSNLRDRGLGREEAVEQLLRDEAFLDSLRTKKTTLQAGLVSIDPHTGYVKAWVGGRDFSRDKYDHVALAERQPGSTFKPFVYTAAIDNGYSPYYMLPDSAFAYRTATGDLWTPTQMGGTSGEMVTLSQGLARSLNTVTARVITQLVSPQTVAFYARRMGIRESELVPVPALALGTSEVTLLELTSAYATLAAGGLYREPTVVTRIEDRSGHVLYEARPSPEEALPEATAYTVVDMMRGVIDYGTGSRIRWQWGLGGLDLAGKTGTTQESADGWFMLMHPDLVTGAWVGFNDRRVTFRSNFWGQGAHNALFLVGDYYRSIMDSPEVALSDKSFPLPQAYRQDMIRRASDPSDDGGRVGW